MSTQYAPEAALTGSMRDFRVPGGNDLLGQINGFFRWQNFRRRHDLWPFSRSTEEGPSAVCARAMIGTKMHGINFASQDYLSLSSHPEIKATAIEATKQYGVHSAGRPHSSAIRRIRWRSSVRSPSFCRPRRSSSFRRVGLRATASSRVWSGLRITS